MKYKCPDPDDYLTDEEYQDAMDAYENALYLAEEAAMEKYYEEKYNR